MFDKIPTHALNDSLPQLGNPLAAGHTARAPIYTRPAVCALLAWNKPLLSAGVPHE